MNIRSSLKRITALCASLLLLLVSAVPASADSDSFYSSDVFLIGNIAERGTGLTQLAQALQNYSAKEENPAWKDLRKDLFGGWSKLQEYEAGNMMVRGLQYALENPELVSPPIMKTLANEIKDLQKLYNDPLTPKRLVDDVKNILKGKSQAMRAYKEAGSKLKTASKLGGKLIGGAFALYSFYQMGAEPNVGYDSPAMEFGANTVRGMSAAAGVILPGVGPLVMSGAEYLVTSETGKKFGNWVYHEVRKTEAGQIAMDTLDLTAKQLNEMGTKAWDPLMYLWYGRKDAAQEKEMAERLEEARKRYAEKHGVPYVKKAKGATATSNNIGVYKPNIYLYPEQETAFSVTFARPELLTVSDPRCEAGWQGTASPDGTLFVGGEAYGFLFYESLTNERYYQREAGYVIPADSREAVFAEILTGYGLNGQEIADFCEFWCEKLDAGKDYAMYPQLTETVDAAMPVTVTPAPDSVLRIWFAFAEEETPAAEAVPQAFAREGSVMTEWGGFFLQPAEK